MKRNGEPEAFRTNCPLSAVMGGINYTQVKYISPERDSLTLSHSYTRSRWLCGLSVRQLEHLNARFSDRVPREKNKKGLFTHS